MLTATKTDESLVKSLNDMMASVQAGDYSSVIDMAIPILGKGVLAICIFIAAYFVAKLMGRSVSAALCPRLDETLGKFAGRFTFYVILICASLGILGSVGINVASAAAVLTAAGFAIGLAFQGTLSNFASGVLLMVFRPFKVGDAIVAGGVAGKVNEIDLFTTTLDTPDNRRLIVPNSAIAGTTIENVTHHPHRRVEVMVGVDYKADIQATRDVLSGAAEALRPMMIEGENRGYQIVIANLGASSVEWAVRCWCLTSEFAKVKELLIQEVKTRLDQASIAIPFPQLQLHFAESSEAIEGTSTTMLRPRLRNPLSQTG